MVGWTISNLWSRLFFLLILFLSLYLQLQARINFNIFYTYMLNVSMLQLCSKSRTVTQPFLTLYNLVKNIKIIKLFYGSRDHLLAHLLFNFLRQKYQSEWRYYLSSRAHFWPAGTIIAVFETFCTRIYTISTAFFII